MISTKPAQNCSIGGRVLTSRTTVTRTPRCWQIWKTIALTNRSDRPWGDDTNSVTEPNISLASGGRGVGFMYPPAVRAIGGNAAA